MGCEITKCPHCGDDLKEFLWCKSCGDVTDLDEYKDMIEQENNREEITKSIRLLFQKPRGHGGTDR